MEEKKRLTVREIREMAKNGNIQELSDELWYDWFCSSKALLGKTKRLVGMLSKVKNPTILDNYTVWFKNNCPCCGPLYDDIRFEPLKADHTKDERKDRYFILCVNDVREKNRYMVWTERKSENEFGADTTKEVFDFINNLVNDFKF